MTRTFQDQCELYNGPDGYRLRVLWYDSADPKPQIIISMPGSETATHDWNGSLTTTPIPVEWEAAFHGLGKNHKDYVILGGILLRHAGIVVQKASLPAIRNAAKKIRTFSGFTKVIEKGRDEDMLRREIKGHEVGEHFNHVHIYAMDAPQDNGASHQYRVERSDASQLGYVNFHRALPEEIEMGLGVNGITDEALLAILADRMKGLQDGPGSCKEFGIALKKIEEAAAVLNTRTRKMTEQKTGETATA